MQEKRDKPSLRLIKMDNKGTTKSSVKSDGSIFSNKLNKIEKPIKMKITKKVNNSLKFRGIKTNFDMT
ncbi:MAG: hypothetical protein J6B63_06010 [Treponema sp.]|nr:hypothetical protein [Treponema sp.]MBP3607675.1 hypothetical protein [Treponema sp.]